MLETQQCPYCKEEIPVKSLVCPVCDTDLTVPPPGTGPQPYPPSGPVYQTDTQGQQWQQQVPQPGQVQQFPYERDVSTGVRIILWLLSIFFTPVSGIIAGAIYKGHRNPANHRFGRTLFNWSIGFLVVGIILLLLLN